MRRDRHQLKIANRNRSSAGKRSSFRQAVSNGDVRAPSFGYVVSGLRQMSLPGSGKSYRGAIGRPAGRLMRQELEPIIAKAGCCRLGMAGKLGDYS
jgi:hypothetical protein